MISRFERDTWWEGVVGECSFCCEDGSGDGGVMERRGDEWWIEEEEGVGGGCPAADAAHDGAASVTACCEAGIDLRFARQR